MADSTYELNNDFGYKCEHAKKLAYLGLFLILIQFGNQDYKKLLV